MDHKKIQNEFPILNKGRKVFLDNTSTTFKPQCVIRSIVDYYGRYAEGAYLNGDRLWPKGVLQFEKTRELTQKFIGAKNSKEIAFARSKRDASEMIVDAWAEENLMSGDLILISESQSKELCQFWGDFAKRKGVQIKWFPLNDQGGHSLAEFEEQFEKRVKLVILPFLNPSCGTIFPLKEVVDIVHQKGALVCVDATQAVAHFPINVQRLGVDFLLFSTYAMFAPAGITMLYGRNRKLIHFECQIPPLEMVMGFSKALEYLIDLGLEKVLYYEQNLVIHLTPQLKNVPGLTLLANPDCHIPIFSFVIEGVESSHLVTYLEAHAICVKLDYLNYGRWKDLPIVTVSFAFYNTAEEGDYLVETLHQAVDFFFGAEKGGVCEGVGDAM